MPTRGRDDGRGVEGRRWERAAGDGGRWPGPGGVGQTRGLVSGGHPGVLGTEGGGLLLILCATLEFQCVARMRGLVGVDHVFCQFLIHQSCARSGTLTLKITGACPSTRSMISGLHPV